MGKVQNLLETLKQQLELDMEQWTVQNWERRGQGCILLPLFNFYAEYITQNTRLDESQVGVKIARRNISNLRYADDTTLMAESEEELKSLLKRSEREE